MSQLLKDFWELNRASVDEAGIRIPHAVFRSGDKLTAAALALGGQGTDTYAAIGRFLVRERPDELVFGMDRFTKPGQGISTRDCLTVHHWTGRAWRFGVIAYQFDPPIFEEIDWDNGFWAAALVDEMARMWTAIKNAPHREPSPAMAVPVPLARFHVEEAHS